MSPGTGRGFEVPPLHLGPITLHAFGALVALAVLVGTWILRRRATRERLDPELAGRMVVWVLLGGFLGAHLVDRLVYFPGDTWKHPLTLLWVWQGISSFGGLLGGTVAAILFIRRAQLGPLKWRYLDAIAFAFVFGWIFGRLGCFTAFDHPGAPTHFFLGETYRDGVMRHNLGLYEALYFVLLAGVFAWLGRRRRAPGFYVALLCVVYPPVRFGLDFLRLIDVRYLGLTPAQWGSAGFEVLGLVLFVRTKRLAAAEAAAKATASAPWRKPPSANAVQEPRRLGGNWS